MREDYLICARGHSLTDTNNFRLDRKGGRRCRTCDRDRARNARERKRPSVNFVFSQEPPCFGLDQLFSPSEEYEPHKISSLLSPQVREMCMNCPVLRECAQAALDSPELPFGVWAGETFSGPRSKQRAKYDRLRALVAEDGAA